MGRFDLASELPELRCFRVGRNLATVRVLACVANPIERTLGSSAADGEVEL